MVETRLAVCRGCEMMTKRKGRWLCTSKRCGCSLVRKARWASESCPLGKWRDDPALDDLKGNDELMPKGEPLLTIGMATFDDFEGVFYTVQALRTYHSEFMHLTELVVVDNNPDSKDGRATKRFMEGACRTIGKYVEFPGTTWIVSTTWPPVRCGCRQVGDVPGFARAAAARQRGEAGGIYQGPP